MTGAERDEERRRAMPFFLVLLSRTGRSTPICTGAMPHSDTVALRTFASGAEAAAWAKDHEIGVALIDQTIPVAEALAFTRGLAMGSDRPRPHVVMVTAVDGDHLAPDAHRAGVDEVVQHTLVPLAITELLRSALALRFAERDVRERSRLIAELQAKASAPHHEREPLATRPLRKRVEPHDRERKAAVVLATIALLTALCFILAKTHPAVAVLSAATSRSAPRR
jgi:CheY-like chemotaxis protein